MDWSKNFYRDELIFTETMWLKMVFIQKRKQGSEKQSHLPEVTELVGGRASQQLLTTQCHPPGSMSVP